MQTALHTAASGLRHAGHRQQATAHDTANLTTSQTTHSGQRSTVSSAAVVQHSVAQISTLHNAGALSNVVRSTDDMLGSLLDILG